MGRERLLMSLMQKTKTLRKEEPPLRRVVFCHNFPPLQALPLVLGTTRASIIHIRNIRELITGEERR